MIIDQIIHKYKINEEDQFWLKAIKMDLEKLEDQIKHARVKINNLEGQNKILLKNNIMMKTYIEKENLAEDFRKKFIK